MLKLNRRERDEIIITTPNGAKIRVVVEAIKDEAIVLAFDAPRSINIVRAEIAC